MTNEQCGRFDDMASRDLQHLRHNMKLSIVYRPIDQLRAYHRKLRKRSDSWRDNMKASIQRAGIALPVLIDQNDVLIGGEGVVEIARELGYLKVPTVRADHLDENEVRLLRLALNKIGEGSSWDTIELADEWRELRPLTLDLQFDVSGFTELEIDSLCDQPSVDAQADTDDQPVQIGGPGSEIAHVGDVWLLGKHRVMCGSSLDSSLLERLMGAWQARMVLTDLPSKPHSGRGKQRHKDNCHTSNEISETAFSALSVTSIAALASCCHDGALLYLFSNWRNQWQMLAGIRAARLQPVDLAVWVQATSGSGTFYRSQHELCFIARNGDTPHKSNLGIGRRGRSRSNVWRYAGTNRIGQGCDESPNVPRTGKRVEMLSDAILDASDPGEIILDGFLGSGSTLIAAHRSNRICFGMELSPLMVDAILQRWGRETSELAVLAETRETFAEVATRRLRERRAISPRPRTRSIG